MVIGLLQGVEVDYQHQSQYQYQHTSNVQSTSTYAPTIAPQYTIGYNPQVILGSPQAQISGGQSQTPQVIPATTITPAIDNASGQTQGQTAETGGNNLMDYAIAGVAIVAAVIILPKLIKGFTKAKTKGVL
jgi:hypothetical protein